MEASKGETGAQHESAHAEGASEQATAKPVPAPTVDPGTAGAESTSASSQVTSESGDAGASKAKAAAVAAVAGVAGGIAVAARDTRRRVLGIPIGRRSRVQRSASVVAGAAGSAVEKVREPAKRVGSRFSRNP